MDDFKSMRFTLAWGLPLAVGAAAWRSPWAAAGVVLAFQAGLALLERVPAWHHSPAAAPATGWHRACLRVHVLLQALLLGLAVALAQRLAEGFAVSGQVGAVELAALVALGLGVGGVTGSQGITFAHELGHSRSRLDRVLAWLLMGSVLYAHFMVEHYRGHHVRAATRADPASARRGESLWRFLPRTLAGSWRSAWALEAAQGARLGRSWGRSPLLWATLCQAAGLAALTALAGWPALLFWLVQAGYAVFLLETVNYIEHYGLERRVEGGRVEPFGVAHAWNADHALTNCFIANLQRHSDHHMHASKPYPSLEALPGPQLPTGYAGCLFLATVPSLWFAAMHPRLREWQGGADGGSATRSAAS